MTVRTRLSTASLVLTVLVAAVLTTVAAGPSGTASAQTTGTGYYMTLVARQCAAYTDVRANRARNNIMQSLRDLGPDTNYTSGEAISVAKESAAPQNVCTPIVGWQFATGTGIGTAVTGPWGSLSPVNGSGRQIGPTQASIPLRNPNGTLSGSNIAGAVSVELTDQEYNDASRQRLWVQGGTRTDPVMNTTFPNQYGFAALRCAVDNLNGDNVEWVGFPQNAKHVLCYAYYVSPPPTAGKITVVKHVTSTITPFTPDQDFRFTGDISYTVPPAFTLAVRGGNDASTTFFRAGASDWSFTEQVPDGWTLTSINCTSTGGSTFNTNVGTAATTVHLAAGDTTARCVYNDNFAEPPSLTVFKTTLGGVGTFDVTAVGSSNGSVGPPANTASGQVTTTVQDQPEALDLSGAGDGPYTLSEAAATGTTGVWRLTAAECDGDALTLPSNNQLPITNLAVPGNPSACSLTNTLDPPGSIVIRKKAIGTTESLIYAVSNPGDDRAFLQLADVTAENQFFTAQPIDPSDATDDLPLGTYEIQQLSGSADDDYANEIVGFTCTGTSTQPDASGRWTVTLTSGAPAVQCDVTDQLTEVSPVTTIVPTTTAPPSTTTTAPTTTSPAAAGTGAGTGSGGASAGALASTGNRSGLPATVLDGLALLCLGAALVTAGLLARRRLDRGA